MISRRAYVLLLNIGFDRTSRNFVVKRRYKNARMTSVLFKMADVNVGYFKGNLDLLKHLHLKYARKRIQHAFVDMIGKSVPRVTVWQHSAGPHDAKQ